MPSQLPKHRKLKLDQYQEPAGTGDVESVDQLLVLLPSRCEKGNWPRFPHASLLRSRMQRMNSPWRPGFVAELPGARATGVWLAFVKDDASTFELLTLARKILSGVAERGPAAIGLLLPGVVPELRARMVEAVVAAAAAASFPMPTYKRKPPPLPHVKRVVVFGPGDKLDLSRTLAAAEGNDLARWLTALPPNHLTPRLYRQKLAKLAQENGWTLEFLDEKRLAKMKAGAFLAVSQGSPDRDAGIAHLRYTPKGSARKFGSLALAGKGICFDTGGTNLKPAKSMLGMHGDMQGSAVALGVLLALTRLKADFSIDCWLALAQNHIGPKAYKQNDVVTACDGTSIEIMHTDAEGRMVLADTLAIASKGKPALLIDYATLTGACVYALSPRYSGGFSNRAEWHTDLIAAGRGSGERVWPFPLDDDYDQALESSIADTKQCAVEGEADHIIAARFLSRFVAKDVPWIHVDLSASDSKGGLAHIPTEMTGFGVRFTLNLVLDQLAGKL